VFINGGYYIGGYLCLLMAIILVIISGYCISGYFANGYWWLVMVIIIMAIGDY
jgi:hypothetical protein